MTTTIRRALYERLCSLSEWHEFRKHFEVATGLSLRLMDQPFSSCTEGSFSNSSPLCKILSENERGRILCINFRNQLLRDTNGEFVARCCDAGLIEIAVPFIVSGLNVGYLVFGGFRTTESFTPQDEKRALEFLSSAGVHLPIRELRSALIQTPIIQVKFLDAYIHWIRLAVRDISARLTSHVVEPTSSLPAPVEKACQLIRSRALHQQIDLATVARHCGVCSGHLSRLFRHTTGLTFTEFIARFRAEHAMKLLLSTRKSVTEIAFESGFNSISQFHRVFRQIYGHSPSFTRRKDSRKMADPAMVTNGGGLAA
ncbi:MAG: helix-turn-helix domain-containing protein [Chthoniobacterales bacterium]|nr:helix-turn-helix domain-containing protein [Chthoniobacterales bacterium]